MEGVETAAMSQRVQALKLDKEELLGKRRAGRRWLWLVLLITLAAAVLAVYFYAQGRRAFAPGEQFDTITVQFRRPIEVVLEATGYVVAPLSVSVSPQVPGRVVELNIEEGQCVNQGDLLVRLDDAQYRADLDQAVAGLASAKARLEEQRKGARQEELRKAQAAVEQASANCEYLAKEFERAEELKDTIAPSEYDRIHAGYLQAKAVLEDATQALRLLESGPREERIAALAAEVERAKAQVDKAQFFHDCTKILAPVTGTVVERSVELGEMVRPESLTSPLCVIADLRQLEIEIDIQERDLANVRLGQPCLVTTEAYPDHEYQGRLHWLSPVFNRQRAVRPARVKILSADATLAPDMNCRVQILKEEPAQQISQSVFLPKSAVVEEDGQTCVYVLENQVARRRVVRLGESNGAMVEIREGLREGEIVLLPGSSPLRDGRAVR